MDSSFDEGPDKHSLELIEKRCYDAMALYLYFWSKKDQKNVVKLDVDDIVFISSDEKFKKNIKDLQLEHLISYIKLKDKFIIKVLE